MILVLRMVEFRIPSYPGPSKERGKEVRLMQDKIFRGNIYERTCSFMLFATKVF